MNLLSPPPCLGSVAGWLMVSRIRIQSPNHMINLYGLYGHTPRVEVDFVTLNLVNS